jgi:hypothetical protein
MEHHEKDFDSSRERCHKHEKKANFTRARSILQ